MRSETPWTFNLGYDGLPEATARAWRNGWFHTGDMLRKDAAGNYYFVDRLKDAIRRRGENVSSIEVEAAVRTHAAVDEVIAVGIPVESEEEVMVVIVPKAGHTIEPAQLIAWLTPRLPYFAVPRFVRIVDAIRRPRPTSSASFRSAMPASRRIRGTVSRAGIVLKRERSRVGSG